MKSSPAPAGLLFVFITLLISISGCATQATALKVNLGQQFSLAVNQSAVIAGENIRITFIDISDSRCPAGATCIWAGEARADIQVRRGETANITLVEPGHSAGNSHAYKTYRLFFTVQPYPEVDKPIARADYRLVLTVNKPGESPVD